MNLKDNLLTGDKILEWNRRDLIQLNNNWACLEEGKHYAKCCDRENKITQNYLREDRGATVEVI